MSVQTTDASLAALLEELRCIYQDFDQQMEDTKGRKAGGLGESVMKWIGSSHVTTAREQVCNSFAERLQNHLERFLPAVEAAEAADAAETCAAAADIMLTTVPARSNATDDLMKRAMAAQFKPFLPYLPQEKLTECLTRIKSAYGRQLFPAEKELVREMERLLGAK